MKICAVVLALLCASAAADTGGRMGGGAWKSGGSTRPSTTTSTPSIGHSAAALEAAGTLDESSLVAVEVVWQPAEDADRMSSIELEAKYPSPQLIPITGALVGKTFCTYCGAPFPAELVSCPHCGAPAQEAHT